MFEVPNFWQGGLLMRRGAPFHPEAGWEGREAESEDD